MGFFLLGDVQRHHRQRGPAAGQLAGLDPGQQPARAQAGHLHRIAHLGALAVAQRALQALELITRAGLDLVAPDRLQAGGQAGRRTARERGRTAPRRPGLQPAARGFIRRHADAGGVHQRTDLQLGQVVLVFQAAVFDHRHHLLAALGWAEGAQPGPQLLAPPVGQGQRGQHLQRRCAGLQRGARGAALPGQQLTQVGRRTRQRGGRRPGQCRKRAVAAHHLAAAVVHQHAHRAEIEPLVELMARLRGGVAGLLLQGDVLHQGQQQRRTVISADPARRKAEVAQPAQGVDHAPLHLLGRLAAIGQRGQPVLARAVHVGMVGGVHILQRVVAQHLVGAAAHGIEVGPVGCHHGELAVLHRERLG